MKEFLNIDELSEYLNLKRSTLYSMVESGEITHYRVGRLIRFKKQDIDTWMERNKKEQIDTDKKARGILKATNRPITDINSMVKKSIEEAKGLKYIPKNGKLDQVKGLREEVSDGIL